ncbi:PDZ domain-containing protein [candidate division KSB1 bacterium]|nr:PDZ domain-containing protein [candidate division KSB1 bacterium]NIR70445.1 PDZ domain-containing protein [candidate division KSB1 bacterium]NIS23175.1 PDZ domain-containing protein [candidate division KSB1 bacterium]NIT70034.1 PDZ domain-containing protein [candidate division KSB1 bacterium]NIU23672.1 PDZ domain-containing protein [candidate division KSB1 bacterium]
MNNVRHGIIFVALLTFVQLLLTNCGHQEPRSRSWDYDDEDGWIGVYVQDLDDEMRNYLDIDERYGVLLGDVVEDSPADDAGLREEDVIIRFDGRRIRDTRDLTRAVRRKRPGDKVEVEIIRDGERRELDIRIGERPRRAYTRLRPPKSPKPPSVHGYGWHSRPWLGVRLANLNEDLAEYFDAREREGVLILSVEENSPAEETGLKAGDVILEIDNRRVRDSEDVIDFISRYKAGDEVAILVKRKGREQSFKARLQRGSAPGSFRFHFDADKWHAWKDDWQDELREWRDDLQDWQKRHKKDRLYDFEDEIRYEIESEVNLELQHIYDHELPKLEQEIGPALEEAQEELRRALDELNEQLHDIKIDVNLQRFDDTI